jgi:hypothetical protein
VDPAAARRALGLGPAPTWPEVRAAYRTQIAAAHPDRAGGDPTRAALLTEAYASLLLDRRTPRTPDPAPPAAVVAPPAGIDEATDGDRVRLLAPLPEALARVVDACHRIGDVTYLDRGCAILETLVQVEGEGTCSLVITLHARGGATDALCTLEAIEHVGSPPVRPVTERLVAALAAR